MDALLNDLRFAGRSLRSAPAFAVIAVSCLALGIGTTTLVFSAVNGLLLRPLPFEDPDRLMRLYTARADDPDPDDMRGFTYAEFLELREGSPAFSDMAALTNPTVNLGGIVEPERLKASEVSASLFRTLGLAVTIGRDFRSEEEVAGGVTIISDGLWQRRFGADPQVVGTTVTIDGAPHVVIGVMAPGVRFPETSQLWIPLRGSEGRQYDVIGRLAPGVTVDQGRQSIGAVAARLATLDPEGYANRQLRVEPYREFFSRQLRPILMIMMGAVLFVLLIACANVANLLLARATVRQKEVSLRVALGASRPRIVRQLLTESLLLGAIGGVLGALLGTVGLRAVMRMVPTEILPYWMVVTVDRTVLLFTLVVSVWTALLFGLAPALRAWDARPASTLKDEGRGATSLAGGGLRSGLVVAQLALSLVLLAGATSMIRSFLRLQTADPGFGADRALTLELSPQGARYSDATEIRAAYGSLLEALRTLAGVESVGAVSQLPIGMCCSTAEYRLEGKDYPSGSAPSGLFSAATPAFFEALGVPLLSGRAFLDADGADAPRVVIVNRTLAEREWPGESAVGKRLRIGSGGEPLTVVGVVADVKQRNLVEPHRPHLYVPHAQSPRPTMAVVLRTEGDPLALAPGVRRVIRGFDPDLPISELRGMREVVQMRTFESRLWGSLLGVFAAAALLLASLGLYGVVGYAVARRTHELGIRVALGALPAHVIRLVLRQGVRLVGLALLIGVPAAFAVTRLLQSTLYEVNASDPLTFAGITLLLAGVALLASYLPARRAARLQPSAALGTR